MDIQVQLGLNSDNIPRLFKVTPHVLPQLWESIIPLFEKGKQYWEVFFGLEDLYKLIELGRYDLWLVMDGTDVLVCVVTEVVNYPRVKVLRILYIGGGDLDRSLEALDQLELWGRRQGAFRCEVNGRMGWIRKLNSRRYATEAVLLTKDISGLTEH